MIQPYPWTPEQSMATLNALWTIATHNGTTQAACAERDFIEGARLQILQLETSFKINRRYRPEQLAMVLRLEEYRSRAAHLIGLLPFVVRPYSGTKSYIAEKFLQALGKDVHLLEDFMGARQKNSRCMEYQALRRMGAGVYPHHHGMSREAEVLRLVDEAPGDKEQLARYKALKSYPKGSLGRAFWEFYAQFNWPLPGDAHWVSEDITVRHDLIHILCDYDVSINGEFLVSAFTAGNSKHLNWIVAMLGFTPPYVSTGEQFRADDFFVAYMRGRMATQSFVEQWDFWPLMEQQIGDLRREYFYEEPRGGYRIEQWKEIALCEQRPMAEASAPEESVEHSEALLLPGFSLLASTVRPSQSRTGLGQTRKRA